MQSSSAVTGIMTVLASGGLLSLERGAFVILGANIGSCFAVVATSLSKGEAARRAAFFNLFFNAFGAAIFVSLALHAVLLGATSLSLFRDWTEYGVHSPSWINAEKTKARKAADEARRKEEAEKKAAAEEAKAAEMRAGATNSAQKASAPAPAKETPATEKTEPEAKTPPEVQPLPPKKSFEYGDDLSLD